MNKKLSASTLIETMIAMVLILICMGIASMIYVSVINSDNASLKLRANLILDEIARQTIISKNYTDQQMESDGLLIEKTLKPYNNQSLAFLCIKAYDKKHILIAEHNELLIEK